MAALDSLIRERRARIIAALAARFRDLDIAEESFAEACARAVVTWANEIPERPDAWLYRTADRVALDILRKRGVRERLVPDEPQPEPTAEEVLMDDRWLIPDERLRLIFVCCHPAVAPNSRAALTLRLVCGLSTAEIARAFLLPEPTLAQRLVRAKRKIAEAGVPFEIPAPQLWTESLDAVLSTLEVAYSKAHEDAAGTGAHAGYAAEMLELTALLARLLPDEADVLALAALVRFTEARRPARVDSAGRMIPLSEQDPGLWSALLIADGRAYLERGFTLSTATIRLLRAAIHAAWCTRRTFDQPPPWPKILALYDAMLALRDDPITRLNRIVALVEIEGISAARLEFDQLDADAFEGFLPYQAVKADLHRRSGEVEAARGAFEAALSLDPGAAEAMWLRGRRDG